MPEEHLTVRAPILLGVVHINLRESLADGACGFVRGKDPLARGGDRRCGRLELGVVVDCWMHLAHVQFRIL